jgi:uncharacterized protein YndB with AHSA1/START domain
MSKKDERTIEMTMEVDAPTDAVWKALTDAEELARWFPLKAEADPRVGGRIWLSWEGEFEGEHRIEIFDPERHLRTTWHPMTKDDSRPTELCVDYHLEGRGGRTVLRLVHSGFGRGAAWDEEYDGVHTGWTFELRSLRHYLERHRGRDRHAFLLVGPETGLTPPEVWGRLMRDGFGVALPRLSEGERYTFPVGDGRSFTGRVLDHQPPKQLAGTVDELNDGILRVEVFAARPHLWLAAWKGDPAAVERFKEPWRRMLERLFPEPVA